MSTILNYNENKVKEGVAKCIMENSFGCDQDKLSFYDKMRGFETFMNQNRRATSKAVHISLNFHPEEKLKEETLKEIAADYMEGIGFGNQPFLVYQHFDAGHPHIHIVSTNIQKSGKRIILFNIGKNQSESARKEIEKRYKLIEATGHAYSTKNNLDSLTKINYGKSEVKRSITNIVQQVVRHYKFTSLPEYNAVLRQFNIVADRGRETSTMFNKRGLHYRILDDKGNKIGVPIKASKLFGKPTLSYLEKQFKLNEKLRQQHKDRIVKCIDAAFAEKKVISKDAFVNALGRENIFALFRQNEEGRIYGITFVDNKTKVVFNGSDLGKPYSAKAITERPTNLSTPTLIPNLPISDPPIDEDDHESEMSKVIQDLTEAKQYDFTSPDSAMKRRRRKKKRGRSI